MPKKRAPSPEEVFNACQQFLAAVADFYDVVVAKLPNDDSIWWNGARKSSALGRLGWWGNVLLKALDAWGWRPQFGQALSCLVDGTGFSGELHEYIPHELTLAVARCSDTEKEDLRYHGNVFCQMMTDAVDEVFLIQEAAIKQEAGATLAETKSHATRQELNIQARDYLREDPNITARELRKKLNCALGTISDLPAWKAVQARKSEGCAPKQPKTVRLSDKLESVIGADDDELKSAMEGEPTENTSSRPRKAYSRP